MHPAQLAICIFGMAWSAGSMILAGVLAWRNQRGKSKPNRL